MPPCTLTASDACAFDQFSHRVLSFLSAPEIPGQAFGLASSDLAVTLDYPLDVGMDLIVKPVRA